MNYPPGTEPVLNRFALKPLALREGGRYRCPIDKFESTLAAVTGLFFFAKYSND
jgi:hypothetical protein